MTTTRKLGSPDTIYVTLKDDYVFYQVKGAKSFLLVNESVFLQANYRDLLSAAFAGGPANALGTNTVTGSTAIELAQNNEIIRESDSFTHEPPRPEEFKRTVLVFYDSANDDSGNVVAYFDFSKVDQFSLVAPTRY